MRRRDVLALFAAAATMPATASERPSASPGDSLRRPPALTQEEILARNAAARGGLDAWRHVRTMAWTGRVESSSVQAQSMPFMLEMERPNKTHFEFVGMNQRMLRVFNGSAGWKLRPPREGGLPEVQAFSPEEVRFASEEQVVDGPLLDHDAKGIVVSLEGMDMVEDRAAYRMAVRMASGGMRRVWIDARTFLDIRSEREVRSQDGTTRLVSTYYRDYRTFGGVQIPCIIETRRGGGEGGVADRLIIERVALNPAFDQREFSKPGTPVRRNGAVVNIEPGMPARSAAPGR